MFVDRAIIRVEAGAGGSGIVSFLRAKFYPMAGPDGGDGGRGGDVYVRGDRNLGTLLDFTYRDLWKAEGGNNGEGNDKTGKSGADVFLPVPIGTVIRNRASNEIICEVLEHGEEIRIAKGGRGGRGNAFFMTSTHQAPREWQPGEEGESFEVELELKLIADIGLVGQPNAGKSTLLSVISAARPKIGNYPFTTLSPNLGVVPMSDHRSFVVADIPGIIEGAHEGKGLGLQFLRHIERTRILAFLIPIESDDWQKELDQLRHEISSHSAELAKKPFCVVFTKLDLLGEHYVPEIDMRGAFTAVSVSAPGRMGLTEMLDAWWSQLLIVRAAEAAVPDDEFVP
ncbi:MAG: GTPase ObgE [Gemmatimonas sp.]